MERDNLVRIGVAILALGGVVYFGKRLLPVGATQPMSEPRGVDIAGMYSDIFPENFGEHFVHPYKYSGPTIVLPVKYPTRSGHNISTLIDHGMSPLYRPRPTNLDWINQPPSEVTV